VLCADASPGASPIRAGPSAQQEGTTVFNWDTIEHEYNGTHYEFEADGEKWRLPHIEDLTIAQQRAADRLMLELVFREVAEKFVDGEWVAAGDEGALLVIGKHADQVAILKTAWLAHAGMEPGESPASSS